MTPIENEISVEDLMKKPQKELLTMIYVQAVKTNGIVKDHTGRIGSLEKDMKDKIGWKMFRNFGIIFTIIIAMITIAGYILGR
jgi:hypothetical protein